MLCCVLAVGCSLNADADRKQCSNDCDCTERGPEFAQSVCVNSWCAPEPKWSCLDTQPTMNVEGGSFPITLRVQDLLDNVPMAGVEARLCRNFDVNCEDPLAGPVLSDDFGVVRFDVRPDNPTGFTGFVLFTRADLMPGMYFFNRSLDRATDIAGIQLANTQAVGVLTQLLEADFDTERGLVLISAYDCKDEPADGVMLMTDDTDERSATFYSVKGVPTLAATATDISGYAGIVNVPPGRIAISGRLDEDGRPLLTLSLLVKAGSITYSRMAPRGA